MTPYGVSTTPPIRRGMARVLLVDDEPAVLDALRRQLRRSFEVFTAGGGAEALELMETTEPFAAVLSDMRMPAMDGATLLSLVREKCPDTVRLLLTGQADMESTIAAINDGQIYRFLSKPSPTPDIEAALRDAAELHRQITAERSALAWLQAAARGLARDSAHRVAVPNSAGAHGHALRGAPAAAHRTISERLTSIRNATAAPNPREHWESPSASRARVGQASAVDS